MSEWILIFALIVVVLVVIGLMLTFVVFKKKKEGKMGEPNYRIFFNIGMIWIPVGVVFMITLNPAVGMAFIAMGVVYMTIGLVNRDKWEKK